MADKDGRGRPTKCTPDVIERAEELMAEGHYAVTVARHMGVGTSTWYRWLEKAEDPEADDCYREFRDAVERGETEAEMRALRNVQEMMKEDHRPNFEYLKRRFRDRWSEKIEQEVSAPGGGALEIEVRHTIVDPADEG